LFSDDQDKDLPICSAGDLII